jgi:nitrate reductase assembly molybdenum cofactor insertion protein NarJ
MSPFRLEVTEALGAAAEWHLLALLLSRPRPGWRDELVALAGTAGVDRGLVEAVAAAANAGEGAYHALLGAGGVASPRAAAHAGFLDPGRLLADLAARYAAFGFSPRLEEPDDHLATECDFVAYLFLKEAFANVRGDGEAVAVTREARARVVAEHVALIGHRFAGRLPADAPTHLLAAARWLQKRLPAPTPAGDGRPEGGPQEDPLAEGCPASCPTCPGDYRRTTREIP